MVKATTTADIKENLRFIESSLENFGVPAKGKWLAKLISYPAPSPTHNHHALDRWLHLFLENECLLKIDGEFFFGVFVDLH
jgi:hypothetical protein